MAKEKGFLTPMTFGMLAGAALSVAAISMSDSRARRAVLSVRIVQDRPTRPARRLMKRCELNPGKGTVRPVRGAAEKAGRSGRICLAKHRHPLVK